MNESVYDQVRTRVAERLTASRPLKPQAERQLADYLDACDEPLDAFLLTAPDLLEEHELDILFAPQFTPTLDDQAAVCEVLQDTALDQGQTDRLVADLCRDIGTVDVIMPDDTCNKLPLHEVMAERFVRLLRLGQGPQADALTHVRAALPDAWPVAAALMRRRRFTPERQQWFSRFVAHMASRHEVERGLLETAADFITERPTLDLRALREEARALVKAAQGSVAYARGGHTYWSADVAQHHHYRGQGAVNDALVHQRQQEADWLAVIEEDLSQFREQDVSC
ncbi:MAG: hypothetical protein CMJ18_01960 [Phycisphaeraceae bacterium]|nr:hypothetical protein [Phycisphaeraceae bacterium]